MTTASSGASNGLLANLFSIDFGANVKGYFTEVSGLSSENEVIEHDEIDEKGMNYKSKQPGKLVWPEVTLKKGIVVDDSMWKWRQMVLDGKVAEARTNATITVYQMVGGTSTAIVEFNFVEAWPSSYKGPDLDATSSGVAIEELTIVHEGLTRKK